MKYETIALKTMLPKATKQYKLIGAMKISVSVIDFKFYKAALGGKIVAQAIRHSVFRSIRGA